MSRILISLLVLALASCSVSLPQKEKEPLTWKLEPKLSVLEAKQGEVMLVVAKPWVASGFESAHVMITHQGGELDILSNASWPDSHSKWLRNYLIEAFQQVGAFRGVSGNQKVRGEYRILETHLWDMSVHYQDAQRNKPEVRVKLAFAAYDGRGNQVLPQTILVESEVVSENRVGAIIGAFDSVLNRCISQIYQALAQI